MATLLKLRLLAPPFEIELTPPAAIVDDIVYYRVPGAEANYRRLGADEATYRRSGGDEATYRRVN